MERATRPIAFLLAVLLLIVTVAPDLIGWGVPSAKAALETVSFDDRPGENQPLTGEYPSGVINWGDGWYHAPPTGAFATRSLRFNESWRTNVTFTFVTARRLVSLQAYNHGAQDTTVSVSCVQQQQPTRQVVVPAGETRPVVTGWTGTCTRVTIRSTSGPATFFDDLVVDSAPAPAINTPGTTNTPGATNTPGSTPSPTSTLPPGSVTATPTQVSGTNFLRNEGFEDGLAFWLRQAWHADVADVQSDVAHSGTQAFWFHGRTNGSAVSQEVAATAGQTITLAGWFKATYKNSGIDWHNFGHTHIKLMALNSSRGKIHTFPGYDGMPIPPGEWTYVTFDQVLPPGTAYLRLQFDTYGLDGTVFIDDLFVGTRAP